MLRRSQLALALILLLVLAPLAGATCGMQCLAATPHRTMPAAAAQHRCVSTPTCCPSSGPVICSAADVFPAIAALQTTDAKNLHDTSALAATAAEFLPQNDRAIAAHSMDSSPPGELRATNFIPLRV